jgi:hypothetical protein
MAQLNPSGTRLARWKFSSLYWQRLVEGWPCDPCWTSEPQFQDSVATIGGSTQSDWWMSSPRAHGRRCVTSSQHSGPERGCILVTFLVVNAHNLPVQCANRQATSIPLNCYVLLIQ